MLHLVDRDDYIRLSQVFFFQLQGETDLLTDREVVQLKPFERVDRNRSLIKSPSSAASPREMALQLIRIFNAKSLKNISAYLLR
jgi:hypothetical protein